MRLRVDLPFKNVDLDLIAGSRIDVEEAPQHMASDHVCDGGFRLRTMYVPTLVSPISMQSLSNSPWIRGTPQSGFSRLITDQFSHVFRDRRSTRLAVSNFPCPEQPEALAVPANDGFRLDDDQGRSPIAPHFAQPSP